MKQVLHIFRKDARRYWRECAISIALMAFYAWNEARGGAVERATGYAIGARGLLTFRFLSGLVNVLLPISWVLVIVRAIQGESLVGDRQFWVTRPYEWKKLLAAKVLFILVFVNFPLLIADVFLLAKAGFAPTHHLIGLLWMQLLLTVFPFLMIAALATVTASLLQMGLAVLVIVLYLIGMSSVAEHIPGSSFSSSIADSLQATLFVGTGVAVILWQYSRRNTVASRGLIVGFAAFVFLVLVASPYRTIVAHQYPLETGQAPLQLSVLPGEYPPDGKFSDQEDEFQIQIPLGVSGIADDSIVVISGVMVELESPDGLRWNSGWRSYGTSLFPEQKRTQIDFSLKKKVFEQLQKTPVAGRISFALTVSRDQNRREFVIPNGEFVMADVGLCTSAAGYNWSIQCRAALRTPSSLMITSDLSQTTCPAQKDQVRALAGEIAREWHHNSESGPAEFGISPVKEVDFYLMPSNPTDALTVKGVCPGTRVFLSNPEAVRQTRVELALKGLRLDDYRLRSLRYAFSR